MFTDPKQTVAALGLREGMRVADFGAGTGAYVMAVSPRVGSTGRVYAVEVQKDMVKRLESELKEYHVTNVDCVWGDIEREGGTKIAEHTMDAVIVSNVLFQASDRLGLVDEVRRVLKKDGRVLVIDWKESFGGMGPSPHHVLSEEACQELFKKRGFAVADTISGFAHHYGIIFTYNA